MTRAGEAARKESKAESKDAPPRYMPRKDTEGNDIWNGQRQGLGWYPNVKKEMADSKNDGCQVQGNNCTDEAQSIDHIKDFATLQTDLPRYVVCDGKNHFSAAYKEDARDLYNGGNTADESDINTSNFQWSCTPCNSSKSGKKGLYENAPQWIEPCPGEDCEYVPRGEETT
ncbi:hypothetical protein WME90_23835 [Sorangium sp. So ce375]|uniref:hypothetical protein n=1 Tax=Sorangium sp. So ce375 TaxID=3133306 RepID=UPI003F5B8CC7